LNSLHYWWYLPRDAPILIKSLFAVVERYTISHHNLFLFQATRDKYAIRCEPDGQTNGWIFVVEQVIEAFRPEVPSIPVLHGSWFDKVYCVLYLWEAYVVKRDYELYVWKTVDRLVRSLLDDS
jgi:hypothetical protein